MRRIPLLLIWSRLLFAGIILLINLFPVSGSIALTIGLFTTGLLTDIFDGIIARRLNISTQGLRRLDSIIDQLFWLAVAAAAFIRCPEFLATHLTKIIILVGLELTTYAVSFARFQKEVATHSWRAKLWVLTLFAALIEIIVSCKSGLLFSICFYTGMITRLEIVAILFVLRKWTNDVPTLYHALVLRKGKPIKRHKLLNG